MRNYYYPHTDTPYKDSTTIKEAGELEVALIKKWESHIGKGWYGFALGMVPLSWLHVIDEFLDYLVNIDPKMEIQQLKKKYGGIRFYVHVNGKDEEENEFIQLQIDELERTLYDEKLIY